MSQLQWILYIRALVQQPMIMKAIIWKINQVLGKCQMCFKHTFILLKSKITTVI